MSLKKKVASGVLVSSIILGAANPVFADTVDKQLETLGVSLQHPDLEDDLLKLNTSRAELANEARITKELNSQLEQTKSQKEDKKASVQQLTQETGNLNREIQELENQLAQKREAEEQAKREAEAANARAVTTNSRTAQGTTQQSLTAVPTNLAFGADGLLIESATGRAQQAINLLLGIPGHANGAWYHQQTGLDDLIDSLTPEEAVFVIHRIEGAGFGQTGDGYAGYDTPASHQTFVQNQVNGRFKGDIRLLLKQWGTFEYGGY